MAFIGVWGEYSFAQVIHSVNSIGLEKLATLRQAGTLRAIQATARSARDVISG